MYTKHGKYGRTYTSSDHEKPVEVQWTLDSSIHAHGHLGSVIRVRCILYASLNIDLQLNMRSTSQHGILRSGLKKYCTPLTVSRCQILVPQKWFPTGVSCQQRTASRNSSGTYTVAISTGIHDQNGVASSLSGRLRTAMSDALARVQPVSRKHENNKKVIRTVNTRYEERISVNWNMTNVSTSMISQRAS